jgi:hypothetical protein
VLLDIGGDVGALVVSMPAHLVGHEVEIRPAGDPGRAGEHRHHYPHVAVVARPHAHGVAHTLVYAAVTQGAYELYPLPDGPATLTVTVTGGAVTRATWPT